MNKIEPLELKQAILHEIDGGIVAVGGNRRIFPYAAVEVRLFAPDEAAKSLLRRALVDNSLLETTIHEHLRPPRCEQAEPRVEVVFAAAAGGTEPARDFELLFDAGAQEAEAYLEVLEGLANRRQLRLQHRETYIGRCEFTPARGTQMVRRNDLYFLDPREQQGRVPRELKEHDEVNRSVSRAHAHITYNEKRNTYYVYDDGSRGGTTLMRGGRGVATSVDQHAGRALESGDVLCFGRAKVRFRLARKACPSADTETQD